MVENNVSKAPSKWYVAFWLVEFVLVILFAVLVYLITNNMYQNFGPISVWIITILIMVILLALAGHEINGQWFGILIDTRNKFSLSRLQITLWTIIVLSAYLTMAIIRVSAMVSETSPLNQQQALDIRFPEELILAMGISAASFAGSNLINSNKKSKQVKIESKSTPEAALVRRNQAKRDFDDAEGQLSLFVQAESNRKQELDGAIQSLAAALDDNARQLAEKVKSRAEMLYNAAVQDKEKAVLDRDSKNKALQTAERDLTDITEAQGLLHKNATPAEASWADLFRGEEISNYQLVEMSKVQMLFFTVVVIFTYVAVLAKMLGNAQALLLPASIDLPAFSQSLNALLGISHGTYLSVKTIDHS